jgi:hypothetical protein
MRTNFPVPLIIIYVVVSMFDQVDGIIQPFSKANVIVTFRPRQPIQYYRRLALIVPDQAPVFLDLLGTCHDQDLRPIILRAHHLARWRTRKERGLSYFAPETLALELEDKRLQLDDKGRWMDGWEVSGSISALPGGISALFSYSCC